MNKKGFTIVELLATIILLAIVTLIAVPSYTSIQKQVANNQLNTLKEEIVSFGKQYANDKNLSTDTYFLVGDLILEGYMSGDGNETSKLVCSTTISDSTYYFYRDGNSYGRIYSDAVYDHNDGIKGFPILKNPANASDNLATYVLHVTISNFTYHVELLETPSTCVVNTN